MGRFGTASYHIPRASLGQAMKVIFAIPTYDGTLESRCVIGLIQAMHILKEKGIECDLFVLSGCTCLPVARNTLVSMFMDTDATDLFFIDADVGFDPKGVVRFLELEEGIIAGVYPLKQDLLSFPVRIKTEDDVPVGKKIGEPHEYLIETEFLPMGFVKIKRDVIEKMQKAYPELKYESNVIEISEAKRGGYDLFNMGVMQDGKRWTTEDYAFCSRWRDIGGQLWVYPNLTFEHVGKKSFKGNYQDYLPKSGKD